MSGAIQNIHSCEIAQLPWISATPVESAGVTEVLVTGMLIGWIRVKARPIAIPAKPAGVRQAVAPMMMNTKKNVITISQISAACSV